MKAIWRLDPYPYGDDAGPWLEEYYEDAVVMPGDAVAVDDENEDGDEVLVVGDDAVIDGDDEGDDDAADEPERFVDGNNFYNDIPDP